MSQRCQDLSGGTQEECCARIALILNQLKNQAERFTSHHDIKFMLKNVQELEDACREVMLIWNDFCIVPLLYLIEPIFRILRFFIFIPCSCIASACSRFLSWLVNFDVKLHSKIAVHRIFSSIFDLSNLNVMKNSVESVFQLSAAGINQDAQFVEMTAVLELLSDLLDNGASDLFMGSSFVFCLFDMFSMLMLNLQTEDHRHRRLISKCSTSFLIAVKLKSKADIVLSGLETGSDVAEECIHDIRSRNIRIENGLRWDQKLF
jgi:hypothetical protein